MKRGMWLILIFMIVAASYGFSQLGLPVGTKATDFVQNDTMGNPIHLSDYQGRYILIDFWASWCVPCRLENPNLVKAYRQYQSKGLEIIGVSLDKDRELWVKAINKDQLTWPQVSDLRFWKNEVAKLYNISALPYNLLIDPDGMIIGKLLKRDRLFRKLEEIFPE